MKKKYDKIMERKKEMRGKGRKTNEKRDDDNMNENIF